MAVHTFSYQVYWRGIATHTFYAFDGKSLNTAVSPSFLCVITLLLILLIVITLIYCIILLFISYIFIAYHIQMQHAVGFYIEVCQYLDWCKFWDFQYLWINSLCYLSLAAISCSLFFFIFIFECMTQQCVNVWHFTFEQELLSLQIWRNYCQEKILVLESLFIAAILVYTAIYITFSTRSVTVLQKRWN